MFHVLKEMRLGMKIGSGFGLIILMAALLGYVAWNGVGKIHSYMSEYGHWVDISSVMTEEVNPNALKISSAIETYTSSPHDANRVVLLEALENTRKGFQNWAPLIKDIPKLQDVLAKMKQDLSSVESALTAYQKGLESNRMGNYAEMERNLKNSVRPLNATLEGAVNNMIRPAKEEKVQKAAVVQKSVALLSMFLTAAVVVIGILISILIVRAITKPLNRTIGEISDGAEQVSSAASQVASASHYMAEASSKQAASIEETSSSLEEMSAMTKQNADNAGQADALMKEANNAAQQASQSMGDLTRSMAEISKVSQETSKIVKTIDEIAFQTNLLALNAAVEAARAGEAGAGFAVVADEVRNLALRAAEAARNTTQMIEGTVKNVNEGARLVNKTNEAFNSVAGGVEKAGQLVAEIAAASHEQAQGIELLNKAVGEMETAVQQIAANGEESASASQQMNSQADRMKEMVSVLVSLVGRGEMNRTRTSAASVPAGRHQKTENGRRRSAPKKKIVPTSAKVVTPKEIIPLEASEFKDF
jgi:methyl-accepting chemotaxis protein